MDCALNTVGFAQTVQDMMKTYGGTKIVDGADNDTRIIGTMAIIFICAICGLGSYYETKVQEEPFNRHQLPHQSNFSDEERHVTYYADFAIKFRCWKHFGSCKRIGTSTRSYRLQRYNISIDK